MILSYHRCNYNTYPMIEQNLITTIITKNNHKPQEEKKSTKRKEKIQIKVENTIQYTYTIHRQSPEQLGGIFYTRTKSTPYQSIGMKI